MRVVLTITALSCISAAPLVSADAPAVVVTRLQATVQAPGEPVPLASPMPAVVTFDTNRDGRRDDFREGCTATLVDDTLTAVCPPLDGP